MFRFFFETLSSAVWRAICAAICTTICLLGSAQLLTACSPGTGGTGTGPIASSASPAISNAENFESSTLPVGSTTVFSSASAATSTTATLQLEANSIQLAILCNRFSSTGGWSISVAGELNVQGGYETTTNGNPSIKAQNATLSLSFGGAGIASSSASATVKDSAGKPLLGPLVLTRGGAGVGAAGALAFGAGC